jgi:hypothetical protein
MKKLLLLLLCVPLMFSCGEKDEKTECNNPAHNNKEFLYFYPDYPSAKECFEKETKDKKNRYNCKNAVDFMEIEIMELKMKIIPDIIEQYNIYDAPEGGYMRLIATEIFENRISKGSDNNVLEILLKYYEKWYLPGRFNLEKFKEKHNLNQ